MPGGQNAAHVAQKQARAVIDQHGASLTVAKVYGVYSDGKLNLQRSGNQRGDGTWPADGVPTPVLNPAQRINAGDMVVVAHYGGKALVMGRTTKDGDRDTQDLSDNKLERNASQTIEPGNGAFQRIYKVGQTGTANRLLAELERNDTGSVQPVALRFHQHGRYWGRLQMDNNGWHFKDGDPALEGYQTVRVADLIADNGATLKDTRTRADNAQTAGNNAQNTANTANTNATNANNNANGRIANAAGAVGHSHMNANTINGAMGTGTMRSIASGSNRQAASTQAAPQYHYHQSDYYYVANDGYGYWGTDESTY